MEKEHYHFIGIGGIGMGTLASLIIAQGHHVSGSDIKESQMTSILKSQGALIYIGHDASNVDAVDYVVYSSAIDENNPEIVSARDKGIHLMRRAELLAQMVNSKVGITIAGAHGKTTTTSMATGMLIRAGLQPTFAIGGIVNGASNSSDLGSGQFFVAEVDESDGSFLCFNPFYSLITNIDFEHIDYYKNWDNINKAYQQFLRQTHPEGCVIVYGDDERLYGLVKESNVKNVTFGLSEKNDVYAKEIVMQGNVSKFICFHHGKELGFFELNVPGKHNILNAIGCIALGLLLDIDFDTMVKSLGDYKGVQRRFQIKGEINDILVVDDYGHHPTEIAETLKTAKNFSRERVVVLFQPHRFSRTKFLMDDFVEALALCDVLIITDIYAASELPIEGVTAKELCSRIKKVKKEGVFYVSRSEVLKEMKRAISPGDLIITLGAGDVTKVSDQLINYLQTTLV